MSRIGSIETIRKIARRVKVMDHLDYRIWLGSIFVEAKAAISGYSYLKFSQDLKLGSSNAHLVIKGNRLLTPTTAAHVVRVLRLSSLDRKYFMLLVDHARAGRPVLREELFRKIIEMRAQHIEDDVERRQLEFFTDWVNAAVLEVLRLPKSKDDPNWISNRLQPKVSVPKVKKCLQLLNRLGYIEYNASKGRLFPTGVQISTGSQSRNLALISYHQQMIELAKDAISQVPYKDREISSVTLSIPESMIETIKCQMIELKRQLMLASDEAKGKDRVVQVNLQMFPLSRK